MAEAMPEDLARRIVLGGRDEYTVSVDGLGAFRCRRRSFFDDARVELEAQRWLQGLGVDDVRNVSGPLEAYGRMYGTVKVSVVEGPKGWSLDDSVYTADLARVWQAVEAEEAGFRVVSGTMGGANPEAPQAGGAGVGVPDVQPAAFKRGGRRADG